MNSIKLSLVCLCLISQSVKGQEIEKTNVPHSIGCGGFTIGYGNMDVSKLHLFVPGTIREFGKDQLVIGGTGHGIVNKLVIGGSAFGVTGDVITTDSLKISLSGGVGTFDFGYLLVNKPKLKIYPLIGIGGSGYGLQITRNRNLSVKQILDDPANEINISHGGFVLDLSINMNLFPVSELNEKKNSYGGFMAGLKIGYAYSLPSSDFNYSGGTISGAPNFGLNMFYVKLIVGGFGYNAKE
jgi:hypothetical protein